MKKELIDFFYWFRNNGESYIGLSIEELVDEYLKSINSLALSESQSVSDNEQKGSCESCRKKKGCVYNINGYKSCRHYMSQ